MIDINFVNIQLQDYLPNYKIFQFTPIDIQYSYPEMIQKDIYVVAKKEGNIHYPYVKVDIDGNIKEVYPSIEIDLLYKEGTYPYCSINNKKEITDIYYVPIDKEDIHRINYNDYKLNRIYKRIFKDEFKEFNIESDADAAIFYYKLEDNIPTAILLNWNAFNENYINLKKQLFF